jgi:hypothetical protein
MSRKQSLVTALVLACSVVLGGFASSAGAAAPIDQGQFRFDSGPYASSLCGIDGTEDDVVVGSFVSFANGFNINPANAISTFTATASGKTVEFRMAGNVIEQPLVANPDGTFTEYVTVTGTSSIYKLVNGPVIVKDIGSITFAATFDSEGNFVGFDVVKIAGPRPAGCNAVFAALT